MYRLHRPVTTALAALALTVTALAAPVAPASGDTAPATKKHWHCEAHTTSDVAYFHTPIALPMHPTGQDLSMRAIVAYKYCHNNRTGRTKVKPKAILGKWWVNNKHNAECRYFDKMTFNFYLWDRGGRNINPGPMTVDCQDEPMNFQVRGLQGHTHWLWKIGGVYPEFKANAEVIIRFNPNVHRTLNDNMTNLPDVWPFRNRP